MPIYLLLPTFMRRTGSVNEVDKESVLQRALAALRGPENGLTFRGRDSGGSWWAELAGDDGDAI
jgi:hypothetical protein